MISTGTQRPSVLVIDDEESIREGCRQALEAGGYWTRVAENGEQGLRLARELKPHVVIVDLKMPGISGMEVLRGVLEANPDVTPIVITGYGSTDSAVEAMRAGASDYLRKPFDDGALLGAVGRGLDRKLESAGPRNRASGGELAAAPAAVAQLPAPAAEPAPVQQPPPEVKGCLSPGEVAGTLGDVSAAKCGLRLLPIREYAKTG